MSDLATRLRRAGFEGALSPDCPLAPLTTWRIGGPAELLASPVDRRDLSRGLAWAIAGGVPWRVLGNGSNLLVRDEGVRGVVFRTRKALDEVTRDGEIVRAGAGAMLPAVSRLAASCGLAGIEFGAGIPGTIGGAIVMNAGWHEYEIGAAVESVEFLSRDGTEQRFEREDCAFGYRSSRFRGCPGIVLGAVLRLEPGDPRAIRERMDGYAASRKTNQPTETPSCGSVFLKPAGDFAGRLIEAAGLKGRRLGDLQVSTKHANFIVNLGRGTAAEALALVEQVEQAVFEQFGVRLVREFELW